MRASIINGKDFAKKVRFQVADMVAELRVNHGLIPGLAVVLVGDDPASEVYVRNKSRCTAEVGMKSFKHVMRKDTSQEELIDFVYTVNKNPEVHGLLVQLPLPPQIDEASVISAIIPAKDVDGFHIENVGLLCTGQSAMIPCTPLGCLMMLRAYIGNLSGLNAVVVGRSNIVGKPMANLLLRENCTVTIAHSRTQNLPELCRSADILVSAVGRPGFINAGWIKPGATVIDVGINRIDAPELGNGKTRIVGDVVYEEALDIAGAITPVPGGVGPMTIACLLANTVTSCCRIHGLDVPEGLIL